MTPDERVEALAEELHDWVGGCCVNRFDDCVFGGSGVREEAARLLKYPALRGLLASERAKALRDAAEDVSDECSQQRGPCFCGSADWLRDRADREVQP